MVSTRKFVLSLDLNSIPGPQSPACAINMFNYNQIATKASRINHSRIRKFAARRARCRGVWRLLGDVPDRRRTRARLRYDKVEVIDETACVWVAGVLRLLHDVEVSMQRSSQTASVSWKECRRRASSR